MSAYSACCGCSCTAIRIGLVIPVTLGDLAGSRGTRCRPDSGGTIRGYGQTAAGRSFAAMTTPPMNSYQTSYQQPTYPAQPSFPYQQPYVQSGPPMRSNPGLGLSCPLLGAALCIASLAGVPWATGLNYSGIYKANKGLPNPKDAGASAGHSLLAGGAIG